MRKVIILDSLTAFSCPVPWIQPHSVESSNFLEFVYVLRTKVDLECIYFSEFHFLVIFLHSLVRSCYCYKNFNNIFYPYVILSLRGTCGPYILACYNQKQKIRNENLVCTTDNTKLTNFKRFLGSQGLLFFKIYWLMIDKICIYLDFLIVFNPNFNVH